MKILSNLGYAPFEMDGYHYASVEAFWQGLKYEEYERKELNHTFGLEARLLGKERSYGSFLSYQGARIGVGSREHWDLMHRACEHKFRQNEDARSALLATGLRPLYHKPRGKGSTTIPGPILSWIWMDIRRKFRNELKIESSHWSRLI